MRGPRRSVEAPSTPQALDVTLARAGGGDTATGKTTHMYMLTMRTLHKSERNGDTGYAHAYVLNYEMVRVVPAPIGALPQ